MFRTRFDEFFENARHEHEILLKENVSLKAHIKKLEENLQYQHQEIKQAKTYIKELNQYITNLRRVPVDFKPEPVRENLKRIKLGSDWVVEGEEFYDISLLKHYNFHQKVNQGETSFDGNYLLANCSKGLFFMNLKGEKLFFLNCTNETVDLTNKNIFKVTKDEDVNNKMCFSTDSKFIYSSRHDKIIRKWDIEEKKLLKKINVKDDVLFMHCYKNVLIAICKDFMIRIFDEDKVKEISVNYKLNFISMKVYENLCYIATTDKKILVYNLINDEIKILNLPRLVNRFDVNENLLLASGIDEISTIYEINSEFMEIEKEISLKGKGRILFCSFINKNFILCAGVDSKIRIWNLETDKCEVLSGNFENILDFNCENKIFCTASTNGKLRIWEYKILDEN
ncbi:hypothetical protein GVAV_000467 [Gurleya vavrai]